MLQRPRTRILILALLHATVDFYMGLLVPLPQPTLMEHLGVGFAEVMTIIALTGVVVNGVQPLFGALAGARGLSILLLAGVPLSAAVCGLGWSTSYNTALFLCLVASFGTGIVHPEAAITAQALATKRQGLAMAVFMSAGYFGMSIGCFVGGRWAEAWGLAHFELLVLPAIATGILLCLSGLHRLKSAEGSEPPPAQQHGIPFALILALSCGIAITWCLFMRFLTPQLVRSFGPAAQASGGDALLLTGLAGALGSWLWSSVSERWGRGLTTALATIASAPFLHLYLTAGSAEVTLPWAFCFGLTAGAVFPLAAVLARGARGLRQRLRMGLVIGGSWGVGEIAVRAASSYVDRFPESDPAPIASVLRAGCGAGLATIAGLALLLAVYETRARQRAAAAPA